MKLTAIAPENGWLEDDCFLGKARPIFRCKLLFSGRVNHALGSSHVNSKTINSPDMNGGKFMVYVHKQDIPVPWSIYGPVCRFLVPKESNDLQVSPNESLPDQRVSQFRQRADLEDFFLHRMYIV